MSSFLQKARDRAQEAAAQLASAHHGNADPNNPPAAAGAASSASPSSSSHISSSTYTGSLPHVFRQGLANFDPRFESTRSLHVMRGALKGVVIDEAALSRETKSAAAKTFRWGLDHRADDRMDGVGDPVLVDVTDRLAYIISTLGDLEQEHSQRLSVARANLKKVQTAELELAAKRAQRVKIAKELHDLTAHRVKPQGSDRATQQSAYLHQLTTDAQEEEEHLAKLKRQALRECFEAQFDSYIQHGEKLSLVASYGKLLAQQIPHDQGPTFPAPKGNASSWEGSVKTHQIRTLVEPALKAYQPHTALPVLPDEGSAIGTGAATGAPGSPATADSAASFGLSHAHELAQDEARTNAPVGASSPDASSIAAGIPPGAGGFGGYGHAPLSPLPESAHQHNPNLNHSPSTLPAAPVLGQARLPSEHPRRTSITESHLPDESALSIEDAAPPGPTVAETGAILPTSPDGPGPKSGTLQPRRKSSAASASKPALPPRPVSTAATTTTASGPVGNTAPAVIPSVAQGGQQQQQQTAGVLNARIRRDGTITRRGHDKDYEQAEEEQLPPYEG